MGNLKRKLYNDLWNLWFVSGQMELEQLNKNVTSYSMSCIQSEIPLEKDTTAARSDKEWAQVMMFAKAIHFNAC